MYLRHSLNDGTAKSLIECYQEAIECLKSRYNRPRLTHQTHVRKIIDCPPLKDGNGRELRRLHDTVRQHLRALKAMDCDPSNPFVTSIIELKLDPNTMFEWQKYSQEQLDVPHYQSILDFIDLRAQASESFVTESRKKHGREELKHIQRPITSYATSARFTNTSSCSPCLLCKPDRHPLYACAKFKALNHTEKTNVVKSNNLCLNCLKPGHSSRSCRSLYHCKTCNKSHHSLLHINDFKPNPEGVTPSEPSASSVTSNAALGLDKNLLLMTCRLIVELPEGMSVEIHGVLDSASSTSFISERLAQVLKLNRSSYGAQISGIGGMLYPSSKQSTATFVITPTHCPERRMNVTAIIVPNVTCNLPTSPVPCNQSWEYLKDVELADPQFGIPGRIDMLLGIEVFASVLRQGRRSGTANSPIAFETDFGWVLAGTASPSVVSHATIVTNHVSVNGSNDTNDILRKFWEIEESSSVDGPLTAEEKIVANHFERSHTRSEDGAFIVPLPKQPNHKPIGESRSMAVRRFVNLEKS